MCCSPKQVERLSVKELYDQYWRCRDFEIKNLWQRSLFLGTFLVLCFTGYGAFFGKAFCGDRTKLPLLDCLDSFTEAHVIAIGIACIGVVFSILWVYMAKASKAWVEVYETAIATIDRNPNFMPQLELKPGKDCVGGFRMENMAGYGGDGERGFSSCLFSLKGGPFSPSRINICIGQISFLIWCVCIVFHVYCLMKSIWGTLGMLVGFMIILCIISVVLARCFHSEALAQKDPKGCEKQKFKGKCGMTLLQFMMSFLLIALGSVFIAIYNRCFK